jgi:dTDP-4-amino-4,6-dideoxygalactose transaminase
MKIPFNDLRLQHNEVREEINAAVERAIETSEFVGGRAVQQFEDNFATYCGVQHAIGVSNGTDALRLALVALGVGPGQIVITVPNTFMATVEAITLAGARPIFVDIDPVTYTMDPGALRSYLEQACVPAPTGRHPIDRATGDRVTTVLPVHLYGFPANMDAIGGIADQYGLDIVEDACQAHGSAYFSINGKVVAKKAGAIGRAAGFSFYPGKNLGAMGEGGAVTTNDTALAASIRQLRNHGQAERYVHVVSNGSNCRLDSIQAAILDAKLKKLDEWNACRQQVAAAYNARLAGSRVKLPRTPGYGQHVYHLYVVLVEERDRVRRELAESGIETGLHYPVPLHLQEAYRSMGLKRGSFPVTEAAADRLLSLPMYPHMTADEVDYVCCMLQKAVK